MDDDADFVEQLMGCELHEAELFESTVESVAVFRAGKQQLL